MNLCTFMSGLHPGDRVHFNASCSFNSQARQLTTPQPYQFSHPVIEHSDSVVLKDYPPACCAWSGQHTSIANWPLPTSPPQQSSQAEQRSDNLQTLAAAERTADFFQRYSHSSLNVAPANLSPPSLINPDISSSAPLAASSPRDSVTPELEKNPLTSPERLPIIVGYPQAEVSGPHCRLSAPRAIFLPEGEAARDPDIIAHEMGHVRLDMVYPYSCSSKATASAHEAFADCTALLTSLHCPQVRKDLLERHQLGQPGGLASVIGEGAISETQHHEPIPQGLRNLASHIPQGSERPGEECHQAALRFSSAVYQTLLDLYDNLRKSMPQLSPDLAMQEAIFTISTDFVGMLEHLPHQAQLHQEDLSAAIIKADRQLSQGRCAALFENNFANRGLGSCLTSGERGQKTLIVSDPFALSRRLRHDSYLESSVIDNGNDNWLFEPSTETNFS